MPSSDWVILLQITLFCLELHPAASLRCIYSNSKESKVKRGDQKESANITVTKDGLVVECSVTDYCFVFWFGTSSNDTTVSQGCWNQPGNKCNDADCISNDPPPKAKNDSMFCCCATDLCNWNYSNGYIPQPTVEVKEPEPSKRNTLTIALILTCVVALITVILIIIRSWYMKRKPNSDPLNFIECPPSPCKPFIIDNLKIDEVSIGRGRYGYVCRGTLNGDNSVAVKIFNQQNRQYFANEKDIYTLPHFQHPCIVEFKGASERIGEDGRTEYLIVLSHAPLGCLNDFLSSQTVDWSRLCKMMYSFACGLTHLHTEIIKEGLVKPCIAHRDLSSRNVLIGHDGGCMICDFGFAIKVKEGTYYHNGEVRIAEATSLADVGTIRYMAPEVLEGAVNLRDCESSLKQADIYSFSLVLWEMATRCTDLYQGIEVPPYQLAYEKEVGLHPSMEKMQCLLTTKKARPLFPDVWKDKNPAIKALKETIVECWDQDAEARLTALCAETRLKDLPATWEKYKEGINCNGVSPRVNNTTNAQHPSSPIILTDVPAKCDSADVCQDLLTKNEARTTENKSVSESTLETVITSSPCESVRSEQTVNLKNSADNAFCPIVPGISVPLQPHQGRNPSIERNLMKKSDDDVTCIGNEMCQKGCEENSEIPSRFADQDVGNILHHSDHHVINVIVPNDTAPQPNRAYHPIPYVRNAGHAYSTIPKLHNSHSGNRGSKNHTLFGLVSHKRGESTGKNSLKEFFGRGRTNRDAKVLDEERMPLSTSRSNGVATDSNKGVIGYKRKDLIAHNYLLQHSALNYNVTDCVVLPAPNGHIRSPELRNDTCVENSALVPHANGIGSANGSHGKGVKQLVTEKLKKSLFLNSNGVRQPHSNGKAKHIEEKACLNGKKSEETWNLQTKAKETEGSFQGMYMPSSLDSRPYCNGRARHPSSHTSGFESAS